MNKIKQYFSKHFFELNVYSVFGFALLWLAIGFSLGTATLLYPVEWISAWAKNNYYSHRAEDMMIKLIMILFIITSFFISVLMMRAVINSSGILKKVSIYIVCYCLARLALGLFLNPDLINKGGKNEYAIGGSQFTLGPFPTEERLAQLKEEGYTTIISLLHPAVVPFEPVLIEKERKEVTEAGMKFINIPMLPWVSKNEEALQQIKALMKNGNEKYYVHCYLGKDRVNVLKRIIPSGKASLKEEFTTSIHTLRGIQKFERGAIYVLDTNTYYSPYPTGEEFFGYILAGDIKAVVSLLDPKNPEDTALINKEERILNNYKINYKLIPITSKTSTGSINSSIHQLQTLPHPLFIHRFKTDDKLSIQFIYEYYKQSGLLK